MASGVGLTYWLLACAHQAAPYSRGGDAYGIRIGSGWEAFRTDALVARAHEKAQSFCAQMRKNYEDGGFTLARDGSASVIFACLKSDDPYYLPRPPPFD